MNKKKSTKPHPYLVAAVGAILTFIGFIACTAMILTFAGLYVFVEFTINWFSNLFQ